MLMNESTSHFVWVATPKVSTLPSLSLFRDTKVLCIRAQCDKTQPSSYQKPSSQITPTLSLRIVSAIYRQLPSHQWPRSLYITLLEALSPNWWPFSSNQRTSQLHQFSLSLLTSCRPGRTTANHTTEHSLTSSIIDQRPNKLQDI